ncbi:unnamed protein product [Trypanosoma congolense IL3000]|uniref:WGS project CAEQ00000000 data, annotated contig 2179 n=1 Tax=Trypanosoma congolense (strain IL3000) TaxID=1068625 RepID=F9WC34_TRYCI|nr:unnamed protein product [Trypanosoma congolense IL3000]
MEEILVVRRPWILMMAVSEAVGIYRERNHNGEHHKLLCKVLSDVSAIFHSVKEGIILPKAVKIHFAKESDKEINMLVERLHEQYHIPENYKSRCWKNCRPENGEPYHGNSIPHDLLCLCTSRQIEHHFKAGNIPCMELMGSIECEQIIHKSSLGM